MVAKVSQVTRNLDNAPNATQVPDDEWLRLEELAYWPEKVAEYDAAVPRRRAALRAGPDAAPAPAPAAPPPALQPLVAPAGFLASGSVRGRDGPGPRRPIGAILLADRRLAARHAHLVRYDRRSALGAFVTDSLLDAASHGPGGRWALLCPVR